MGAGHGMAAPRGPKMESRLGPLDHQPSRGQAPCMEMAHHRAPRMEAIGGEADPRLDLTGQAHAPRVQVPRRLAVHQPRPQGVALLLLGQLLIRGMVGAEETPRACAEGGPSGLELPGPQATHRDHPPPHIPGHRTVVAGIRCGQHVIIVHAQLWGLHIR